ncbi:MAG: riboflavin biosynthesis protein RibF [Aquiluna sp.]|nr:riboflavin biosynthesis protein RibF [Aquiluna sp.]
MLQLKTTDLPADFAATAVAIGKFDGVHLGHQQLIHELVQASEEQLLSAAVLTFDKHPDAILNPGTEPASLIGPTQKARFLSALGVDALVTIEFDQMLAMLTPEQFVVQHLVPMRAKLVLIGNGFRFGVKGSGNIETLKELGKTYGFQARAIPSVMFGEVPVSSTAIRTALLAGKVDVASVMLGRNHEYEGIVEHGRKIGRSIGFPTANLARSSEGLLPVDGVYAGWLHADGIRYPAAHSVGTNDSIEEVPRLLESHVIGRDDLDLYDLVVTAEFVEQVRPWAKFESMEVLINQIAADVQACEEVLGE